MNSYFLDTNIVIFLYEKNTTMLSEEICDILDSYENTFYISHITNLELQYLFEIQKIIISPEEIISSIQSLFPIEYSSKNISKIIEKANTLSWTRDPFDRIIAANALIENMPLITSDRNILAHCKSAIW